MRASRPLGYLAKAFGKTSNSFEPTMMRRVSLSFGEVGSLFVGVDDVGDVLSDDIGELASRSMALMLSKWGNRS